MPTQILTKIPGILYKYRDWSDEFHKKLLTDQELYFASSKDFNDPFDARMNVGFSNMSRTDSLKAWQEIIRMKEPNKSASYINDKANKMQNMLASPLVLEEFQQHFYERNAARFAILSLSSEPDNILLWSHYAQSHKGFVVGFDTQGLYTLVNTVIGEVQYQESYPQAVPNLDKKTEILSIIEALLTKSSLWAYEKEVRILKPGTKGIIVFPKYLVKEIFLGYYLDEKNKKEITELVLTNYPEARIFQAEVSPSHFSLKMKRIY